MIEKEYKYVLDIKKQQEIRDYLEDRCFSIRLIEQYYFNESTRIRCINEVYNPINYNGVEYYFTAKIPLRMGHGCYEFERPISEKEFNAMKENAISCLFKKRYSVIENGLKWEIDFFNSNNENVYCILAEIEVDEREGRPSSIPDFITDNLVLEVPENNKDYNNYNISINGINKG